MILPNAAWLLFGLLTATQSGHAQLEADLVTPDLGNTALLHPLAGLSGPAKRDFFIGKSFFHSNWVVAPATTTGRAGLGPYFNARACGGCHAGNGRGSLASGDRLEAPAALVIRLSVPQTDLRGAPKPEPNYGSELSPFAIPGVPPEGKVTVTYSTVQGTYADGEHFVLREPHVAIGDLAHGRLASGVQVAPRFAPPIAGVGLFEAIADSEIEAEAVRQKHTPGAVKGRINRVWNSVSRQFEIGRYGWKSNVASLAQQIANAFASDIGITSSLVRSTACVDVPEECSGRHDDPPEIDDATLGRVITYVRLLAPPPRLTSTTSAIPGELIFDSMGCEKCHKPAYTLSDVRQGMDGPLQTAPLPSAVRGAKVKAYSDLLLHDMGPGLAYSRPEFDAGERDWRTAPLWGIGLTQRITGSEAYLHDGRARSLAEAILWHDGEAHEARESFRAASSNDRAALIEFLRTL